MGEYTYTSQEANCDYTMQYRLLDLIMSDINLGVIVLDQRNEIVELSELACRIFGLDKCETLGKPVDAVIQSLANPHRLMLGAMTEGVVYRNYPVSITNGSERFELLMDTNPMKGADDRMIGMCVTFKDVTNLRSLEEQVIRSDRLATIGQIAAGAAHEIRNPLTSIRGFLQLFERRFAAAPGSSEQNYIRIMMKEIDRINQLVNEFLLLSKSREPRWQSLKIPEVIDEIMPILSSEAILKNVLIEHTTSEHLPSVIADSEMLKQVILNLSRNAFEAMPNGGSLTIDVAALEQEKTIQLRFTDTGHGIAPYLLDKIFEPFYSTKMNGTGLGLSICQRIVHDIGGQIRVSSKGYGTTFYVKIPYIQKGNVH